MLRPVHDDEVGGSTDFDQSAIEVAHARRIAGGETKGDLGRDISQAGELRHHAQDAKRLYPGTGRTVRAQNDTVQALELMGMTRGQDSNALVAVVHDFYASGRALA